MKNFVTVTCCLLSVLLVIIFRSEMYEISADKFEMQPKNADTQQISPVLTVHYHERRPFYLGVNEEVHGLVADPVGVALKLAEIDFSWVETPAGRQLEVIRDNKAVTCAVGWFKTQERLQFAKYSLPVYQDKPFVGVTRSDNSLLGERENLELVFQESRLRLLVKSGYSYGAYIDKNIIRYEPWVITTTADNSEMLHMLRDHRADYCLMTEEEAYELLLYSGVNKANYKIVSFEDIPKGNMRYLICSMMTPDSLLDIFNGAISHILPHMKKEL